MVFVSNKKQVVPLWRQKAGKDEEKLVIWDYHVLLILRQVGSRIQQFNSMEKLSYDLRITCSSDKRFPTGFDHRVPHKELIFFVSSTIFILFLCRNPAAKPITLA